MARVRRAEAWFAVRALYRADRGRKGANSVRTLLEESVLLFKGTPLSAAAKGHQVCKRHQHSYTNVYGEMVSWKLHQVLEIVEVMDQRITEGSEVYHRFHLNANPDATAKRLGFPTKKAIVNVWGN
jgi:hypothetical protein